MTSAVCDVFPHFRVTVSKTVVERKYLTAILSKFFVVHTPLPGNIEMLLKSEPTLQFSPNLLIMRVIKYLIYVKSFIILRY